MIDFRDKLDRIDVALENATTVIACMRIASKLCGIQSAINDAYYEESLISYEDYINLMNLVEMLECEADMKERELDNGSYACF